MVSVDDNTRVAMEIVSQGVQLTGELVLRILRELSNGLKNDKDKFNQKFITPNEKSGEMRIKNLVTKHKDGIDTLDDNLTKDQIKEYSKDFKSLGVDFSVVKVSKDSYSLFFSAKDSIVIEKSLKNIIEKKDLEITKEKDLGVDNSVSKDNQELNSDLTKSETEIKTGDKINLVEKESDLNSNLVSTPEKEITKENIDSKSKILSGDKTTQKKTNQKSLEKDGLYSMKNVKDLDKNFREENKNKEKVKKQELNR